MKYVKGDIREATEKVIGHGCNCQGVMGSGVALAIKNKWPEVFESYVYAIENGAKLGECVEEWALDHSKVVLNLLTQENFGTDKRQVNYAAIVSSILSFLEHVKYTSSHSTYANKDGKLEVALPKIGAGLGGGEWSIIETLLYDIEDMYKSMNLEFTIYYFE